jgi:hypothetical protein
MFEAAEDNDDDDDDDDDDKEWRPAPILGISDSSANVIKITYLPVVPEARHASRYSSDFSGCY